jgi:endonuclease YncB( thermonuclease family)
MNLFTKSIAKAFAFVLIFCLCPQKIMAKGPAPSCPPAVLKSALVAKVKDDASLLLENGESVRLIGVMPVKLFANARSEAAQKYNELARQGVALLRSLVTGKRVQLRQSGRKKDRYGRVLAHVYTRDKWLQGALLQQGLARSYSYRDNRACLGKMLELEQEAREQKRGLWRYRTFAPIKASEVKRISRKRYRFTLVEGQVRKIARVKSRVFLNFGEDWRKDFTIAIRRKYLKAMRKDGLDVLTLQGKRVRVRGWVEVWNGPAIKATHAGQIELLE